MKYTLTIIFCTFIFFSISLPTLTLAADWEPCYAGILRCDENGIVWNSELVLKGDSQVAADIMGAGGGGPAAAASTNNVFDYIGMIAEFINGPVILLLFSIALLFFIFNIARYFIIEAANGEKKSEAKNAALYGIAALVILVSIWGVVNMLVRTFELGRDDSICPDYFKKFNIECQGDLANFEGPGPIDNGNPYTNQGNGTPGTSGVGGGGALPSNPNGVQNSKLGVLIYGDLKDQSNFNFRAGTPRAQSNTVSVASDASCQSGLNTLSLAAGVETSQASYLMYKNNTGATHFLNLTDITTGSSIDIDADTYGSISTKSKPVIIHTHPKKEYAKAGLPLNGRGPSAADMELLCDSVANDATYVVLDGNSLWSMTKSEGSCPRTTIQSEALQTIDALLLLSQLPADARAQEYGLLTNGTSDTPSLLKNNLLAYESNNIGSISSNEVFILADNLARAGAMQLHQQSISDFCSSY